LEHKGGGGVQRHGAEDGIVTEMGGFKDMVLKMAL